LDNLKADGITLYTRYGTDNHYLGHPDFRAVWDLLDARGAVVFIHPTHPVDTTVVNPSLPQPMIDYPHETTRAAVDLITSGTVRSHPNVKIILSHAGGTLPYLALRPAAMLPHLPGREGGQPSTTVTTNFLEDARSFYFDTALSAAPLTLALLKDFAKPGHVLFGSDYPYAPSPAISQMNKLLDAYEKKDGAFVRSLSVEAAVELFPRLASIVGS
jgi:predicted TIM-barrel fold metal-dependent hydrolase